MAAQMALAAFVIAAGFVVSALISHGAAMVSGHSDRFRLSVDSWSSAVSGFFVCLFAGPFLTLETGTAFWRKGQISNAVFAVSILVSVLWSFCSGIFIIQLLAFAGLVAV